MSASLKMRQSAGRGPRAGLRSFGKMPSYKCRCDSRLSHLRREFHPHCGEFIPESAGCQQACLRRKCAVVLCLQFSTCSWHNSSLAACYYLLQPSGNMQTILSILNFPVEFPYA